jgi:hypothetical protein
VESRLILMRGVKEEAVEKGVCLSCGQPPLGLTRREKKAYKETGLCPLCYEEIFGGETEEKTRRWH